MQWERDEKKNLPEEEVPCQKSAEESGSVCKIFSGELEITPRKDLKEQETLSLQQRRNWEREAEEQSAGPKAVLEKGLGPGASINQPENSLRPPTKSIWGFSESEWCDLLSDPMTTKGETFAEELSSLWSHLQVPFKVKFQKQTPRIGASFELYFLMQISEAFPIPCFDPRTSSHDLPKRVPVVEVQFSCRFNFILAAYIFDTLNVSLCRRMRDLGVQQQMVGTVVEGKERDFNGELKNVRVNLWHGDKIKWCIASDIR